MIQFLHLHFSKLKLSLVCIAHSIPNSCCASVIKTVLWSFIKINRQCCVFHSLQKRDPHKFFCIGLTLSGRAHVHCKSSIGCLPIAHCRHKIKAINVPKFSKLISQERRKCHSEPNLDQLCCSFLTKQTFSAVSFGQVVQLERQRGGEVLDAK